MSSSGRSSPPAVSIITPAYNAEPYLADTIESALAQTFSDFEMLIVDDGSTDGTTAIAQRFAAQDSRIRVFRQANMGISGARNAAMARARGAVFALLDSDDVWFPNYLEEQMKVLDAFPAVGVTSANAVNFGGGLDGRLLKRVGGIQALSLLTLINKEDSVCIMSMFRREVFDRIGGFDTALRSSEDYDFWLRAALAGFEIRFNSIPLGYYRRRPQSVSADLDTMIGSTTAVLRKTKRSLSDASPEAAAVDRQLARFEFESIANRAKMALHRRDFTLAAELFGRIAEQNASMKWKIVAFAARHTPGLLLVAHRARCAATRRPPRYAGGPPIAESRR
jgi:glycosyltransferase involved in cell wall biosynthesis